MIFVDTNYFLRFFLDEPGDQQKEARALFQSAAHGQTDMCTSLIVFFEIYWVTSSFYRFDKPATAAFLHNMLRMEFIHLENRDMVSEALALYEATPFDLEDAYHLVYARQMKTDAFMTFDRRLAKKFDTLVR